MDMNTLVEQVTESASVPTFEIREESVEDLLREGLARENLPYVKPTFSSSFYEDHLNLYEIIKEQMVLCDKLKNEERSTRKRRIRTFINEPLSSRCFEYKRMRYYKEDIVQE